MIKSMTGFGRSEMTFDDAYEVRVQIKSVNHRYADFSVKAPKLYGFLEEYIRTRLSRVISRGKVEVYVSIHKSDDDTRDVKINRVLAEAYIRELRALGDIGVKDDITASTLSAFSDIFEVEYKEVDEKRITEITECALDTALNGFVSMRESEGERLKASIKEHLSELSVHVDYVRERSPLTVQLYRERLEKRLRDTLEDTKISADESRVLTEVAIFADKVAVDEEVVRLESHISEFNTALDCGSPIGKKLDFIVQEMNRETNTIGSKCSDIELSKHVVEMKSIIEKIREQIQNIE